MPGTNIYPDVDAPEPNKRSIGEAVQIAVLSVIILVFFVIAASNGVGLMVSAMHH
jgi:hypothetical protein